MNKSILLAMFIWLSAGIVSYQWNVSVFHENHEKLALQGAQSFFQQVVLTREWNALHNGVYIAVTDEVSPNPYLKDSLRDLETSDGLKLTKVNPAYMTRQIAEVAMQQSGVGFHITSLKPIRPENVAADWETKALKTFEQGVKEYGSFFQNEAGKTEFRYMAPLITHKSCLKCHAEQGYKEDEIRGGISVTLPFAFSKENSQLLATHVAAIFAGLAGLLFFNFNLEKNKKKIFQANQLLENSNKGLEQLNEEMQEDLQVAEVLQKLLFTNYSTPTFLELHTSYLPFSHVSGDIFNICEKADGSYTIFLGDGTGHGIAAAFTTIMAKMGLDEKSQEPSPIKLMEHLNAIFEKQLPDDRYMSAIYVKVTKDGRITTVNAGHPPLLIVTASGEVLVQKKAGLLLGLFESPMLNLEEETYQLEVGDRCFLITDGITERANPAGEQYGMDRFKAALRDCKDQDLVQLLATLSQNMEDFAQDCPPNDDITIVAFEYKGKID